ncbi:MAG: alpha/beta hydrolase [Myxococcota bacterium]|nr:alpha/beta hydrolase [Myxococcota bacterium]
MPYLDRDGVRLYFETRGQRRSTSLPILMQHPLCSNLHHFDDTTLPARLLEQGHFLIFPESIAHGRSIAPDNMDPRRFTLGERARDVLAILDVLDVDRFAYCGYSMGTWIGRGVIAKAPERVLAASLGGFDIERGSHTSGMPHRLTRSRLGHSLLRGYSHWSGSRLIPGVDNIDALQRCFLELYKPMPPIETLEEWGGPLLLWSGKRDLYHGPMKRASRKLSNALFHDFPGNHFSSSSDERLVEPILDVMAKGKRAFLRQRQA